MDNKGNVSLAVLVEVVAVLILVGVTLNAFTRMNVKPKRYLDQIRARMLAQTGFNRALSELKLLQVDDFVTNPLPAWQYCGEDSNRNNQPDKGEDQNHNNTLEITECPLNQALLPSFFTNYVSARNTDSPLVRSRQIGYSSESTPTYPDGRDVYSLKIIDCAGQIYVNGTDDGTRRLLNNLGTVLKKDSKIGDKIFNAREKLGRRFTVKEELEPILGADVFNCIKHYVTIYGWANPKVIKPNPATTKEKDIYSWSELNPGNPATEPRAPININTACKPVLAAALGNLEGVYLSSTGGQGGAPHQMVQGGVETPASPLSPTPIGRLTRVALNLSSDRKIIDEVAERIIKRRLTKPFGGWQDFNEFCDQLVKDGIFGKTDPPAAQEQAQAKADLIKANANPNTLFNKFCPDRILYRWLDKSDLISYTTEFCFMPAGYFEIESSGMVFKPSSHSRSNRFASLTTSRDAAAASPAGEDYFVLEAEYLVRGVVNLFDVYYETSQADFARGGISKTKRGTHDDKTLASYPEPAINPPCATDGFIGLSTIEKPVRDKDKIKPPEIGVTFKASYRTINADYAAGNAEAVPRAGRPNTDSIFNAGMPNGPGSLYPDGVYSDATGCPAYHTENNLIDGVEHERLFGSKRFRGTVSFWLKPNYYQTSAKPRIILSATKPINRSPHPDYHYQVGQNVFEVFAFPQAYHYPPAMLSILNPIRANPAGKFVWFWEIDETLGNQPDEYIFANNTQDDPLGDLHHQWLHIGIAWDTHPQEGIPRQVTCQKCNGKGQIEWYNNIAGPCRECNGLGEIPRRITSKDVYAFCLNGNDATSRYIYHQPGVFPPEILQPMNLSKDNLLRLGELPDFPFWNSSGDFTVDEVTIQLHDTVDAARGYLMEEFRQGRYYRGDGVFTSGQIPLSVSPKTRIMTAWTVYYPPGWDTAKRSIETEFIDASKNTASPLLTNPAGSEFELSIPQATGRQVLAYKIYFRDDETDLNTPLTATPFVDDISILVFKPNPVMMEQYVLP
ncbi:MAG: hypothetical protein HY762_03970 [Planctomycetes bacterium]|nr:hypothetical protein [Planctomycetota bacterium]